MRLSTAIAIPAVCFLISFAAAQSPETHELPPVQPRWKAGDKVRVRQRQEQTQRIVMRSGLEVVDEQNVRGGFEQRYVLEVTKVDEKGRIVEAKRTYEALHDLERGEAVAVDGLVVRWLRDPDGALRWEPPAGATLDRFVRETLDEDLEGPDEPGEEGAPDAARLLFSPGKPVAVGETWELDLAKVAPAFGISPEDVVKKRLQGKLVEVEPPAAAGGTAWLKLGLELQLELKSWEGRVAPRPVEYTITGSARLPAGGQGPERTLRLEAQVRGALPAEEEPGARIEFDMRQHLLEEQTRVP